MAKATLWSRATRAAERRLAKLRGKQPVHFLHIGKTGGTAIKAALERNRHCPSHLIVLHRHGVKLADIPAGESVFFFLRDPVQRFVSGFNSRLRKGQPRTHIEWSAAEAAAFARFTTPDALACSLDEDNEEYRHAAETAMRSIQHVRSPYSSWLRDSAYLRARQDDLLFVGRQEQLADDFERLRARLRFDGNARLPVDPVAAHATPDGMETELSARARRNLQTWYAQDYVLLQLSGDLFSAPTPTSP